jgi:hypothetical protein
VEPGNASRRLTSRSLVKMLDKRAGLPKPQTFKGTPCPHRTRGVDCFVTASTIALQLERAQFLATLREFTRLVA